jgi:hypothetical protein
MDQSHYKMIYVNQKKNEILIIFKTEQYTLENGIWTKCMVKEFYNGPIILNMRAFLLKIKDKERVVLHHLKEIYMKEIGMIIKHMDKALNILKFLHIGANGMMIYNKEKVKKYG